MSPPQKKAAASTKPPLSLGTEHSRPLTGILLLILSTWALSTLDASGKWIMGTGVTLLAMCWVRYLVHLVVVISLAVSKEGWAIFHSKRPGNQVLRGAAMLAATLFFFTTLSYLPQAEATAIGFLAPLIVLALAPWILKEPPRVSRWVAAACGFIGVLVIIRPSSGLHPLGVASGLLTACAFATQFIATRRVAIDNPLTTLIWSGIVGAVCLTLALPFFIASILPILANLTPFQWLILLSTGVWGALGHLLQIQAYQRTPASMLAPFMYLQIISASTMGWLVWGHFPDLITWVGIAIICTSGMTIATIEWKSRKAA